MATLTGRTVGASYIELLKLNTASTNTGVTGSLIDVTDGGNTASALSLSTSQIASSVDGSAGTAAFTRKGDTNTGVFFPGADTIAATTNGTERMRITSAGNVGIGTTSPSANLHVLNDGVASTIRIGGGSANTHAKLHLYTEAAKFNFQIAAQANVNNALEITPSTAVNGSTFSTPAMVVTSAGNIGIGVTAPLTTLHLQRTAAGVTTISNADPSQVATYVGAATTAGNYQPLIGVGEGAGSLTAVISSFDDGASAAQGLAFHTGTNSAIAERLRITSTGNVGIGTSNPGAKLDISAGVIGGSHVGPSLRLTNGYTDQGAGDWVPNTDYAGSVDYYTADTSGTGPNVVSFIRPYVQTASGAGWALAFGVSSSNEAATERMRIASSGNVGIGTTSPTEKLHVSGGAIITGDITQTNGATTLARNSASVALSVTQSGAGPAATFTGGFVGIGMTPTAQLELSTDSAKKPSTNTWTITSDERLKTSIVDADKNRCYEIVKQVPLKRYTWKSEVYSQDQVKDRSKLGWIAQDVEAVFPKAVGTNRFAYNQVFEDVIVPELDSEGNAVFEDVVVPELDSDGNAVFNEDGVAKTRIEKSNVAKTKTEKRLVSEEVIEDCKDLNSDQMYAAMYGTIQKLIEKVETLEAKVLSLQVA